MFKKMVAIEPVRLTPEYENALLKYAEEVTLHPDMPENNAEIIRRIGDADAVLVSYTTRVPREVIFACPNIRYIGMCCSLYSPESANVDILAANERGIVVRGVRDYGDEGVPEYVISELVRLLHGFGGIQWRDYPHELTDLGIGVLGMGTTGRFVARALKFFGANVRYYSRTRKPETEAALGIGYLPLDELLKASDIVVTCLNRNAILLREREFELFGDGKILMNISIGPGHDVAALKKWLSRPGNFMLSDIPDGTDPTGELLKLENVICVGKSAGNSTLTRVRLGKKTIENIEAFFRG